MARLMRWISCPACSDKDAALAVISPEYSVHWLGADEITRGNPAGRMVWCDNESPAVPC